MRAKMTKAWLVGVSALSLAACATGPTYTSGASGVDSRALSIHQRLLTLDTHLDTPALLEGPHGYDIAKRHDVDRDGSEVDLPRMNEGGLDGGFWAIYMPQGALTPEGYARVRDNALIRSTSIHEMVAANPDKMEIALTPDDARRINAAGKKFVFMSMENSYELGNDITLIDTFYKLGVRLMGPVHNGNNQLADSANPGTNPVMKWGGLSPMGKEFVKRCNELGIVLDGSHSGDATIEQMIDLSAVPIILSHHGVRALNDHPRNLPDNLLKKLAAKGGVAQMNTLFLKTLPPTSPERSAALKALSEKYPEGQAALTGARYEAYLDEMKALNQKFPEPRADFEDYMKQILYAIKLIGVDHVGIGGADWDGGGGLNGYRDVSYMPRVTQRLLKEGYTEEDLAKLWGGNVIRVMQQAQDYAASLKK
ncbi:MAG TPA: dipeptidase [Hyphomonadaceae bacterium]|nr:dipeptidase [Hyphomonadaceae bacterium]